jgi:hypothetical protein
MVLLQDESTLVEYEEDFDLLYYLRQGPGSKADFRSSLEKVLHIVEEKKVRYWLINFSASTRTMFGSQDWMLANFEVSFYQNNVLEKIALIPPRDLYNLMTTERIVEQMLQRTHFEFQYFNEEASARDWLEESFREVCFHEEDLEIEFDNYHNWIYANWKGRQDLAAVKKGCQLISDLLDVKGCCKLLNDNRLAFGGWNEAVSWLVLDWAPRQEQQGLKAVAWILSTSTLHQLSTRKVLQDVQTNMQVEIFQELFKAKQWLDTVLPRRP